MPAAAQRRAGRAIGERRARHIALVRALPVARPIILGGLIAPVLWSGILYSSMQLLNPLLASHIDWAWFMTSQIAFGVVAGLVVVRQQHVPTRENLPFFVRAGIEAPGIMPSHDEGEKRP